jgi:hypothetical protein
MTPTLRLLFGCCALLALANGHLFAAGEYQQARDSKTTIWNWQPKPGETADWSGGRDKDGYANGFGDLTWYNANGKVFGLFYGNMTHGKFEGGVNVHTGGRVSHAYFVNGERVTSWSRGSAKSSMTESEAAAVEKRKAEAEKVEPKKEKVARAEAVATPTPTPKKEQPKIAKAESVSVTPAPPAEKTTRGPDSYHKEKGNKSTDAKVTEKKSESLSYEEELKRTEPSTSRGFTEPTPLPKSGSETPATESVPVPTSQPSEPKREVIESPPPALEETRPPVHQPMSEQTPEVAEKKPEARSSASNETQDSSSVPATNETPADISSLAGPPSSLRTNSIPESSAPEKSQGENEAAPKADGPLTETEAIKMADTEARVQGAPLDNYDRPKVDHSQVKGRWTLFYGAKKTESASDMPPFTVTIEDKTRKVELKK